MTDTIPMFPDLSRRIPDLEKMDDSDSGPELLENTLKEFGRALGRTSR